jgi:branched-chain amino acid transport system substrate-binding protein
MKRVMCILLALSMMTVAAFAAGQSETAVAGEAAPIKVGLLFPRTGSLGLMGEESLIAGLAAIDQINSRGGINGRKLEAHVVDVKDTAAAQSETNRLIQQEGVKILFGTYGSALSSVMTSVANRNGAYYMEVISVADGITDRALKGIFRLHFKGSIMGESAIDFAAWLAKKASIPVSEMKLACFYENSDFGVSTGQGMDSRAKELGMQVVVAEKYSKDVPDTSPMVLKAKAQNANFMIMTPYINDGINFVRMSKNLDFNPAAFIGLGTGFALPLFWETLQKDAEGMFDLDPLVVPYMDTMMPSMKEPYKEFENIIVAKTGHKPIVVSMLTWQAVWLVMNEVVAKVQDPDNLDQLIAATQALDLPLGALPTGHGAKFDATGQNLRPQIGGMQWQNGELLPVYPEAAAAAKVINFPFGGWKR